MRNKWKEIKQSRTFRLLMFCSPKEVALSFKDKIYYILSKISQKILFSASNEMRRKLDELGLGLKLVSSNTEEFIYEKRTFLCNSK